MAFRYLIAITFVAAVVSGQNTSQSSIPGSQTAAEIAASSLDRMSGYLAPKGPIVPAVTLIAGLPIRGAEVISNGLTRISSSLDRQARSLSRRTGQNPGLDRQARSLSPSTGQNPGLDRQARSLSPSTGQNPGLDTAESYMPESIANMGRMKNNWIRNQAKQVIESSKRLDQMMSVRASQSMPDPGQMLSSAQDFLSKSASTLEKQAKQHLDGTMGRLSSVQGIGRQVLNQAQELAKTASNGFEGALGQLHQTGQNAISQIQHNRQTNMQSMSGVLGSLQGSMDRMRSNMQANMNGAMQHAQSTAQQLSSGLQGAVQAPIRALTSLQNGLGSMMKGGLSSSSGRY